MAETINTESKDYGLVASALARKGVKADILKLLNDADPERGLSLQKIKEKVARQHQVSPTAISLAVTQLTQSHLIVGDEEGQFKRLNPVYAPIVDYILTEQPDITRFGKIGRHFRKKAGAADDGVAAKDDIDKLLELPGRQITLTFLLENPKGATAQAIADSTGLNINVVKQHTEEFSRAKLLDVSNQKIKKLRPDMVKKIEAKLAALASDDMPGDSDLDGNGYAPAIYRPAPQKKSIKPEDFSKFFPEVKSSSILLYISPNKPTEAEVASLEGERKFRVVHKRILPDTIDASAVIVDGRKQDLATLDALMDTIRDERGYAAPIIVIGDDNRHRQHFTSAYDNTRFFTADEMQEFKIGNHALTAIAKHTGIGRFT